MSDVTFDDALQELNLAQSEADDANEDIRQLVDEMKAAETRRFASQARLTQAQAVFLESGLRYAREIPQVAEPVETPESVETVETPEVTEPVEP